MKQATVKIAFEVIVYVDAEGETEQDILDKANDIAYTWDGAQLADKIEDFELLWKKSELEKEAQEILE